MLWRGLSWGTFGESWLSRVLLTGEIFHYNLRRGWMFPIVNASFQIIRFQIFHNQFVGSSLLCHLIRIRSPNRSLELPFYVDMAAQAYTTALFSSFSPNKFNICCDIEIYLPKLIAWSCLVKLTLPVVGLIILYEISNFYILSPCHLCNLRSILCGDLCLRCQYSFHNQYIVNISEHSQVWRMYIAK